MKSLADRAATATSDIRAQAGGMQEAMLDAVDAIASITAVTDHVDERRLRGERVLSAASGLSVQSEQLRLEGRQVSPPVRAA